MPLLAHRDLTSFSLTYLFSKKYKQGDWAQINFFRVDLQPTDTPPTPYPPLEYNFLLHRYEIIVFIIAGEKVEMTAPVLTTIIPESSGNTTYIMHFMIPHDKMVNTPVPSADDVYLVELPAMDVYVK